MYEFALSCLQTLWFFWVAMRKHAIEWILFVFVGAAELYDKIIYPAFPNIPKSFLAIPELYTWPVIFFLYTVAMLTSFHELRLLGATGQLSPTTRIRKKREEIFSRIKTELKQDINVMYGIGIIIDNEKNEYPDTDRSDFARLRGWFPGEILGFSEERFLEIIVGREHIYSDKKDGKWKIDHNRNASSGFYYPVVGFLPFEWIEDFSVQPSNQEPKIVRVYAHFRGRWGTPFLKFRVCKTDKIGDHLRHTEIVTEYDALLTNSYWFLSRTFLRRGRKFKR